MKKILKKLKKSYRISRERHVGKIGGIGGETLSVEEFIWRMVFSAMAVAIVLIIIVLIRKHKGY